MESLLVRKNQTTHPNTEIFILSIILYQGNHLMIREK